MSTASSLSVEDVRRFALNLFHLATEQWRRPDLTVEAMPNFDGDEALFIRAVIPDTVKRPNGPQQIDLQIEIGKLLMAQDDRRLICLSTLNRSELDELTQLQDEDLPDDA